MPEVTTNEVPQLSKLATARNIALEKGSQRREKVSGFFSKIRDTINHGINYVLGAPDAAAYLGKEAIAFGAERVTSARESVVNAGKRAWEGVVNTEHRLESRVVNARNSLVTRVEHTRDSVKNGIVEISKRAAILGLKIAQPFETGLQRIYEIPAAINEWRARGQETRVQTQDAIKAFTEKKGEEAVAELQRQIEASKTRTAESIANSDNLRTAALEKAGDLIGRADARRLEAGKFSKVRDAIASLQTR